MERRDFLKLGTTAGLAAGAASCVSNSPATAPVLAPNPPMPDMDEFLGRFDRNMEAIRSGQPFGEYRPMAFGSRRSRRARRRKDGDALARKALRSIYVAGAIRELPPKAQEHPAVRERLAKFAPEADEAAFGTAEMLRSLSGRQREQLRVALRRDRHLPMRVAELLDEEGRAGHVGKPPRRKFRAIMTDVSWRLRNQPPSALIDECVGKVRRVGERHGYAEELQREIATRAAETSFWGMANSAALASTSGAQAESGNWTPVEPSATDTQGGFGGEPAPPAKKRDHPGSGTVSAGLWMLGIGAGLALLGGALASAEFAFIVVATIGVVLAIIGLITLIIGGIIYAASGDPKDESQPEPPGDGWQEVYQPDSRAPPPRPPPPVSPPTSPPAPAPTATTPVAPAGSAAPPEEAPPPLKAGTPDAPAQ